MAAYGTTSEQFGAVAVAQRALGEAGLDVAAALGGIAVAIWNRRTLAKMRQPRGD